MVTDHNHCPCPQLSSSLDYTNRMEALTDEMKDFITRLQVITTTIVSCAPVGLQCVVVFPVATTGQS